MASRLVHFGYDNCHRLAVLSRHGYIVEESGKSVKLLARLLMHKATDAVAISEDDRECDKEVIRISRSLSPAPIVLFEGIIRKSELPAVDLAIPLCTHPSEWLAEIERIIQLSKRLRAESQNIREHSVELRKNARAARAESASAQETAANQIQRSRKNSNNEH